MNFSTFSGANWYENLIEAKNVLTYQLFLDIDEVPTNYNNEPIKYNYDFTDESLVSDILRKTKLALQKRFTIEGGFWGTKVEERIEFIDQIKENLLRHSIFSALYTAKHLLFQNSYIRLSAFQEYFHGIGSFSPFFSDPNIPILLSDKNDVIQRFNEAFNRVEKAVTSKKSLSPNAFSYQEFNNTKNPSNAFSTLTNYYRRIENFENSDFSYFKSFFNAPIDKCNITLDNCNYLFGVLDYLRFESKSSSSSFMSYHRYTSYQTDYVEKFKQFKYKFDPTKDDAKNNNSIKKNSTPKPITIFDIDGLLLHYQMERTYHFDYFDALCNFYLTNDTSDILLKILLRSTTLPNVFSRRLLMQFALSSRYYDRHKETGITAINDASTVARIGHMDNNLVSNEYSWLDLFDNYTNYFSHITIPLYEKYFFICLFETIERTIINNTNKQEKQETKNSLDQNKQVLIEMIKVLIYYISKNFNSFIFPNEIKTQNEISDDLKNPKHKENGSKTFFYDQFSQYIFNDKTIRTRYNRQIDKYYYFNKDSIDETKSALIANYLTNIPSSLK